MSAQQEWTPEPEGSPWDPFIPELDLDEPIYYGLTPKEAS